MSGSRQLGVMNPSQCLPSHLFSFQLFLHTDRRSISQYLPFNHSPQRTSTLSLPPPPPPTNYQKSPIFRSPTLRLPPILLRNSITRSPVLPLHVLQSIPAVPPFPPARIPPLRQYPTFSLPLPRHCPSRLPYQKKASKRHPNLNCSLRILSCDTHKTGKRSRENGDCCIRIFSTLCVRAF